MKAAIAGGGTGGHLFPGLAVAERLRSSGRASEVVFFGARRGIESRVVEPAGFELIAQDIEGLRGRGASGALRGGLKLAGAVAEVRRELRGRGIDVLVGLGGYASAPSVIAAATARVPVVLLEQNRRPGMANRVLARLAAAVCTSFEQSAAEFPSGKARYTGNPLRAALESAPPHAGRDALLVFGGSAGARSLNSAVTEAAARLAEQGELPALIHQTGQADFERVAAFYRERGIEADVRPFIDDMAAAYARARLAVCRAGATSVAELAGTATPALFLPFPAATGDHQTENARAVAEAGAAEWVRDDGNAAGPLFDALRRLLRDRERLDSMADAARALGRPGAADRVLDVIEEVCDARV